MRIMPALRIVAVNLGLLLALAVAAELAFGTWFSRDPLDHLSLPRDFEVTVPAKGLYPGGEDFTYRRDHWGFRGPGVDPAAVTIVTLGGSTTNQLFLPDDKTWQAVMAAALADHGRQVVVANAGLDGQTTIGHIRVLESWLPAVPGLKPRFVVAYVGLNDVHVGGSSIDRMEHSSLWKRLKQQSAILRLWATVKGTWAARRQKLNHHAVDWAKAEWTDRPARPDADAEVGPYKERLGRMAELVHGMGAVPVFVTQSRGDSRVADGRLTGLAAADGLNGVDQYRLLARFNAATLAVCAEKGLLCLDLAREVKFADGDFYDLVHNTPQGAEKVGRWLAAKLAGLV